jgi:FdhD protein
VDIGRVTVKRPIARLSSDGTHRHEDTLAAEEPLEIRVNGAPLTVTMRTPGDDVELAHGFLLTEGVIGSREDVSVARYCPGATEDGRNTFNVLDLTLAEGVAPPDPGVARNFYTTSSCGVCGKAALDAVRLSSRYSPAGDGCSIDSDTLTRLPDALRASQKVFAATGGLHAAGLFRTDGTPVVVREDVGRHNAVDKALGYATMAELIPLRGTVLMVSGRASFELVQKAAMAGVPMLAAVSAPSSLAVELAAERGMSLVGFLRGESMNVYAGTQRVMG